MNFILVKENWDADEKRLKTGLQEQEEVLMQFEKDLASKEEEINDLKSQVEKLLQSSEKVKDLTKDNDNLEEQCERLKIKVFFCKTYQISLHNIMHNITIIIVIITTSSL